MKADNLIGTISTLYPSYEISFDFKPTSFPSSGNPYTNILHLTQDANTGKLGDRIQGLWLIPGSSGVLRVHTDQDGTRNVIHDSTAGLSLNDWNSVKIRRFVSGSTFSYKISLNDNVYFSQTDMTNDNVFTAVNVWASNPWHPTAEGTLRNLKIRTSPVFKTEGRLLLIIIL